MLWKPKIIIGLISDKTSIGLLQCKMAMLLSQSLPFREIKKTDTCIVCDQL